MSGFRRAGIRGTSAILIAVIGGLTGCSKPSATGGGEVMANGQWLVGPPGKDPAKTADYLKNKISFGKKEAADSAFSGPYPCATCPGGTANLWVVPEKQSLHVNWDDAFRNDDTLGVIVAKVVNDNPFPYPELQLGAKDSAYLWVGPISNDGIDRAIAYYKINAETGEASAPINPDRSVVYCDMPKWKGRTHAAAKGEHPMATRCYEVTYNPSPPRPAPTSTASARAMPLFTNVSYTSAMFRSSGTWISCVYGCCEVGYAE
jgi:hypothetical protein